MAAGEGFEPSQTDPESVVLPLHNPAMNESFSPAGKILTQKSIECKAMLIPGTKSTACEKHQSGQLCFLVFGASFRTISDLSYPYEISHFGNLRHADVHGTQRRLTIRSLQEIEPLSGLADRLHQ